MSVPTRSKVWMLIAILGILPTAVRAESELIGHPAPAFVLPTLGQDAYVHSDTLFDVYGATILTFWTTHCAECTHRLERFQELYDWGEPKGLNVVVINFDDHPTARTRMLADATSPRLLHMYDPGGQVSGVYGAGSHSFTAFVVDEMGVIRAEYPEIMPDAIAGLRPEIDHMLNAALDGGMKPPAATGRPGLLEELALIKHQKLELHGRGRLRWMQIDTTGVGAVGSHGEPLAPGASLRHRMDLELSYQITPSLKAGGLIRLSNEGDAVLRSGPDYFSHAGGTAFIHHSARGRLPLLGGFRSQAIGGYYQISLTPLTLMRWDQNDTPISGGQRTQGCGVCGGDAGMAGFIRSESLEKLGPDLSFEGARLDVTFAKQVDLLAFYARPQTPNPDPSEGGCCDTPLEETYYLQQLYGGRLGVHFSIPWSPEPVALAGMAMLVNEDENSPSCDHNCMQASPYRNRLLGGSAEVPLHGRTTVEGEVVASLWTQDKDATACGSSCDWDGTGARIELTHEIRTGDEDDLRARLKAAFIDVSGNFYAAYSALSYESNLQGFRAACRIDWGAIGLGGFFKQMEPKQELSGPAYADPLTQRKRTASLWADAVLWPGGVVMAGMVSEDRDLYDDDFSKRPQYVGELGPQASTTLIFSAEQEIAPQCTMMAEVEWSDGEWLEARSVGGSLAEVTQEYTSTVVRVMADVEF